MAWATYATAAEAQAAVAMTGKDFNGRPVTVQLATRDPSKPRPERAPRGECNPRRPGGRKGRARPCDTCARPQRVVTSTCDTRGALLRMRTAPRRSVHALLGST